MPDTLIHYAKTIAALFNGMPAVFEYAFIEPEKRKITMARHLSSESYALLRDLKSPVQIYAEMETGQCLPFFMTNTILLSKRLDVLGGIMKQALLDEGLALVDEFLQTERPGSLPWQGDVEFLDPTEQAPPPPLQHYHFILHQQGGMHAIEDLASAYFGSDVTPRPVRLTIDLYPNGRST